MRALVPLGKALIHITNSLGEELTPLVLWLLTSKHTHDFKPTNNSRLCERASQCNHLRWWIMIWLKMTWCYQGGHRNTGLKNYLKKRRDLAKNWFNKILYSCSSLYHNSCLMLSLRPKITKENRGCGIFYHGRAWLKIFAKNAIIQTILDLNPMVDNRKYTVFPMSSFFRDFVSFNLGQFEFVPKLRKINIRFPSAPFGSLRLPSAPSFEMIM